MAIKFERLAGLPGIGPIPEQFTYGRQSTHSEGLVLRFFPNFGTPWIGNFQRSFLLFDGFYLHPNGANVLVVAGGEGYIIDPESHQCVDRIIDGAVQSVHPLRGGKLLVLSLQDLRFEALGPKGVLWSTRQLSYDGFRNLVVTDVEIRGEGWTYNGDLWFPFKVDVMTGRSEGGACHPSDAGDDQIFGRIPDDCR